MSPRQQFVARLKVAGLSWVGTPFRANSCLRGPAGGVCCHKLIAALYAEAGIDLGHIPDGPPGHARYNQKSIIEPGLDACPRVHRRADPKEAEPGDVLGFCIGHEIHHVGVLLPGAQFVHAILGPGVVITPLQDPTWRRRLAAAWEPLFTT